MVFAWDYCTRPVIALEYLLPWEGVYHLKINYNFQVYCNGGTGYCFLVENTNGN